MMERSSQTPLGLWTVLARCASALHARAAENIASFSLSVSEFGVLEVLFHKGPLPLSVIQSKILVSSGGISFLVDRLQRRGLVQRQTSSHDRRVRHVCLTEAGRAFIAEIFPRHKRGMEARLAVLSPAEQDFLRQCLRRLGHSAAGTDLPLGGQISADDKGGTQMIEGLHHSAYRCRDSEETRQFYEDFLQLPLVEAFPISETKTGRAANVLHTFYQMQDGSCIAFFEAPAQPFEFKRQHDYDLHIALRVNYDTLQAMFARAEQFGIERRGISDHGVFHSVYFRDPNGYVVELTAPVEQAQDDREPVSAREMLENWQQSKQAAV